MIKRNDDDVENKGTDKNSWRQCWKYLRFTFSRNSLTPKIIKTVFLD